MRLPTPEALLISSVINTGDWGAATGRGIDPEHFVGYRSEWEWLGRYLRTYHDLPSADSLLTVFPDFPYRERATEVAFTADQVIERSNQRTVKAAVLSAADHLAAGDTESAMVTMNSVRISAAATPATDAVRSSVVADMLDADGDVGVPYPWTALQAHTGGMRAGDFCVYAARTSVGKSWALAYTACCAVSQGFTVRYYSLEMPVLQVVSRLHVILAANLGITLSHTALHQRTADRIAYKRAMAAIADSVGGKLEVVDSGAGAVTPATVAAGAEGVDLVIVDYLGLMSLPGGSRAIDDWRMMASISNQLKEQAIITGTPILAASQINREGGRGESLPTLRQLAQSDAIGQDADVVVTMRRMPGPAMKYGIAKNRHGANEVSFWSRFLPDGGHFNEVSRETAEQLSDDAEQD